VVAAFIAACRAELLSELTIEFYLEGLNAYAPSRVPTTATSRWPRPQPEPRT
jgi:hypothetical protein